MLKSAFGRLSTGVCRQPQWVYVGVFMYSLPGWELCPSSGLCSGMCRQPQWVYVGVFMYSLAGCSFVLPADFAPACADSRSGFMSGCLCIHWPGAALSFQRILLRRVQTAAVGLCRGVYVFIARVEPVLRSELYLIIHAEIPLRLFMDFSAGSLCIFNRNITAFQEKLYLILRAALTPT